MDTRKHLLPTAPRSSFLVTAALVVLAVVAGSLTAASPAVAAEAYFCPDATQPYVPVATAEAYPAGEPVTGLSVTSGTTPEEFTGTYIGFVANALGVGKDMLLFRLSSPVIDGANGIKGAGIWAGMSGSPVYDKDKRLIGAVAYSLNSENLPIAGVTPAEYMRTIGSTAISAASSIKATSANLRVSATGLKVAGAGLSGASFTQVKAVPIAGPAGASANAFINRTLARTPAGGGLASFLRSRAFQPAGATSSAGTGAPLVAGGTISVMYASGDLVVGGVGTVTAVCGTSVWAFGHPMAYQGRSTIFMGTASTALIVPDGAGLNGSYKQVSQLSAPVGMITEDRLVGIKGTIGAVNSVPLTVQVRNASGASIGTYHADISDPKVASAATASLLGVAVTEKLDQVGGGSATLDWTVDFTRADHSAASLSNSQFINDDTALPDVVGVGPAGNIAALVNNKFEDVALTGITATLTLTSADSISYRAQAIDVHRSTGWTDLDGARLRAGRTYSFRPSFVTITNGREGRLITGDVVKVKLSAKAAKRGSFTLAATTQPVEECTTATSGDVTCPDTPTAPAADAASFDDLLALLVDSDPGNQATGTLSYRLKKGSTSRFFVWTTPAALSGDVTAAFTIKR